MLFSSQPFRQHTYKCHCAHSHAFISNSGIQHSPLPHAHALAHNAAHYSTCTHHTSPHPYIHAPLHFLNLCYFVIPTKTWPQCMFVFSICRKPCLSIIP